MLSHPLRLVTTSRAANVPSRLVLMRRRPSLVAVTMTGLATGKPEPCSLTLEPATPDAGRRVTWLAARAVAGRATSSAHAMADDLVTPRAMWFPYARAIELLARQVLFLTEPAGSG
jgi:hypothetical protein